jgi:hypothetical protein
MDIRNSLLSKSIFRHIHAIAPRNVTDPTGRVVVETISYSVARFHHGAWIGMSILALVLLTLCALLAGLTLGVCGLDTTLLHLRCATGTTRERFEDIFRVVLQYVDNYEGDRLVWSLV